VARDGLLGESRPSAYLANAAVCNICITSELSVIQAQSKEALANRQRMPRFFGVVKFIDFAVCESLENDHDFISTR